MKVENKVAIVTGAGQGIGEGIALKLAEEGANVVIADLNPETAGSVAEKVRGLGRKALAVETDVTSSASVNEMVKQVLNELGTIDILVNNAAGVFYSPSEKISENGWNTIMQACLTSTFLCSKAAGLKMIEQRKGNIINISSIAGTDCLP